MSLRAVAKLDLAGCPEDVVMRGADPDRSLEEKFFRGWVNACTNPPHCGSWRQFFAVPEAESGQMVLEHGAKDTGCLLTGEPEWADYTVEGAMRQYLASSLPSDDDEFTTAARTGLVFRVRSVRRRPGCCRRRPRGWCWPARWITRRG